MKHLKFITFNRVLIALIVIIAIGMLTWNRIEVEPHMSAVNFETGEIIQRGEIMSTSDDFAAFEISDSIIYLARNTEVKLVDGRKGQIDMQLIQGRVVLEGSSNILIREIDITTEGQASIVHYSWLDEVEIATIDSAALVTWEDQALELADEAVRMQTLESYDIEYIDFNPEESSEAEFYNWVASN